MPAKKSKRGRGRGRGNSQKITTVATVHWFQPKESNKMKLVGGNVDKQKERDTSSKGRESENGGEIVEDLGNTRQFEESGEGGLNGREEERGREVDEEKRIGQEEENGKDIGGKQIRQEEDKGKEMDKGEKIRQEKVLKEKMAKGGSITQEEDSDMRIEEAEDNKTTGKQIRQEEDKGEEMDKGEKIREERVLEENMAQEGSITQEEDSDMRIEESEDNKTTEKVRKGKRKRGQIKEDSKKKQKQMRTLEVDWKNIKTLEELKETTIRAVPSRLQSLKSYRNKTFHPVTGAEVIQRLLPPENLSMHQVADFLCLGKDKTRTPNNREELKRLVSLVPGVKNNTSVTSAWTLLTHGDVKYQIASLQQTVESVVDKDKISKMLLDVLPGSNTQKKAQIEQTKIIMKNLMKILNQNCPHLNIATHGEFLPSMWNIMESMLPEW